MKTPSHPHRRRLALDLPVGLHRRIKVAAVLTGEPIRVVAERALSAELLKLERRIQAAGEGRAS